MAALERRMVDWLAGRASGRYSLFWLLQLSGWGIFGAAMFAAGLSQWPLAYVLTRKISMTVTGFAVTLALGLVFRLLRKIRAPQASIVAAAAPLSFLAAGAWMSLYHLAMALGAAGRRRSQALAEFPDFTNTIYFAFVVATWSVLYFAIPVFLGLREEHRRSRSAEMRAREARLAALRLQLNPHFLFNALNGISTLVAERRNADANRMLSSLAAFLRQTLDGPAGAEVRLADEMDVARGYLAIERYRFEDRLRVSIEVEDGAENALVPPLILQPIVENAVRYAVASREHGGSITLTARRDREWLLLDVDDDGPGPDGDALPRGGVGLSNTRARLEEMYGRDAELRLSRNPEGGLGVTLRLPFRAAAANPA